METITEPNLDDILAAVNQLKQSGRGQRTLKSILEWLEDSGLGLDGANQNAVAILLRSAWGKHPMTTRDAIKEALGYYS